MMRIIRVNSQEFEDELKSLNQIHAFNIPHFAMLNNIWVDDLHFLLFKSSKIELAITLGQKDKVLLSPFSAPFGGFSFLREDLSVGLIMEAVTLLLDYGKLCNCSEIKLTFPPSFYAPAFLTKLYFCCSAKGARCVTDLNYAFNLCDSTVEPRLNRNYWRNLTKGKNNHLCLVKCDSDIQKELSYEIIEENRTTLGYPLRMGFQPLLNTSKIIDIDFFLLKNPTEYFASAICYWVAPKIVQIIYWGDYTHKRGEGAMHQLSVQLQEYYKDFGVSFLDVGPSSLNGHANVGLCDFKESIGCEISLKNSYHFDLHELSVEA